MVRIYFVKDLLPPPAWDVKGLFAEERDTDANRLGIELDAGLLFNVLQDQAELDAGAVRAIGGHGFNDVSHGKNLGLG